MRLLLVAPDTDLPKQSAEVAAIANLANVTVQQLQGQVRRQDVREKVGNANYDILWVAGHGDERSIMLSDGPMDYQLFANYVKLAQAKLVYLNTCSSLQPAQYIAAETGADVICTVVEVPDSSAYERAALFGLWLSRGKTYQEAFDLTRRGAGDEYRFIPGRRTMESGEQKHITESKAMSNPGNGQTDLKGRIEMLEKLVFGDPRFGLDGMATQFRNVTSQIAHFISIVSQLEPNIDKLRQENAALREEMMSLKATISGLHRERIELERKMEALSVALSEHNIAMAERRAWYVEYAAPLISLIVLLLMVYVAFYIMSPV